MVPATPRAVVNQGQMNRFVASLAARASWTVGILAGLLVLAASGWREQAPKSPWSEDPSWDLALEADSSSGLSSVIGWVALFGEVDAGEEALRVLESVEAEVEALPWVEQVLTPSDMPGASYRSGLDTLAHPLAGPLLGSKQGYLLPFFWNPQIPYVPEDWEERQEAAVQRGLVQAGRFPGWEAGITGADKIVRAKVRAFQDERWAYTLGGTLLVFILAAAVFRNVRAVFLAGLGPLLGVAVAIGISRMLGLAPSGFTAVVLPLLILTIGFTDSLHLVLAATRIHRQASGRLTPGAAAAQAAGDLALPCALTSLTTAIGFGSMALAENPIIVQFGLSCALATMVAFVCVLLAVPTLARTPLGQALGHIRLPEISSACITKPLRMALAKPRWVASGAFLATLVLIFVATQLRVDGRVIQELPAGSETGRLLGRCDAELGGVFPLHVRIEWDEGVPLSDVWDASAFVRDTLNAEPRLAKAVSVIEAVRGLSPGKDAWAAFLGGTLFAHLPQAWRQPFIDRKARSSMVHTRMPDLQSAVLLPLLESIRLRLASYGVPGLRLTLTGLHLAYLETASGVTRELGQSLALAAFLILTTLGLAFRSWRMALASLVPNLMPVAASAVGLVCFAGGANLSALTALTLALGIAADDTIHVLAHWRLARCAGLDARAAAERAVERTLPALMMTTLNLTAAFGLLMTSNIPTIASFGLLVAVTLVVALLADVFLLPALLVALDKER